MCVYIYIYIYTHSTTPPGPDRRGAHGPRRGVEMRPLLVFGFGLLVSC